MINKWESSELLIRPAQLEDYAEIREFLLESSSLYPGIEFWWDNRVRPTIEQGRRVVLVVDAKGSLEGLFIGKPGNLAKLCTLRLRESVRNQGVGRVLVTEGLNRLLDRDTSRFHVTISEAAEKGCTSFFESIGFQRIAIEPNRYKKGLDEFVYSCQRNEVVEIINNELSQGIERTLYGVIPKQMPKEQTLLMSLKPEFAELILQGRKTIEFRRKFSKKYEGAMIVFYISRPLQQFMFTATIAQVDHNQKKCLWSDYEQECGISQTTFDQYFYGIDYGYAIRLSNVKTLPNQLALEHAKNIYPQLRPPQSFQRLGPKSPLLRALDLPVHI
ncbi:MAG TPA: GNAT family N-acetyltransferase [Sedimentisphaerales bacterium]|nr:GNAT family N-acetyltransferase [Sedimentisphaerales bacterium]